MALRQGQDTVNWNRNSSSHLVENSFWKRQWTCR